MSYRTTVLIVFANALSWCAASSGFAQHSSASPSASLLQDAPATQNETFRLTSTPNVGPSNTLTGVKTISPTEVWAVGSHGPAGFCCFPKAPVSLRWNGSQWIDIPLPVPAGTGSTTLLAVDASSSTNVWAVGTIRPAGESDKVWLLRWNGSEWNTVALISDPVYPGYGIGVISSLTVISETDVWVVGARIGGYSWTLHCDGVSVQTVPSPNLDSGNKLNDVDAINSNDVWAVGSFMVIRNNGAGWLPVPNAPRNAHFSSIQAIAPNDVWATATFTTCGPFSGCSSGDGVYHFDGSQWTIVPVPGLGANVFLRDLSATDSNNVWLVGSDSQNRTFVAHFDGSTWQRVASENTPASSSDIDRLESVSALNSTEVWSVGSAIDIFYDPNHRETSSTLALRRTSDAVPTPTAVVSRKLHNGVPFDINLPVSGNAGIESRSGGSTNDHQVVLTFDRPVTFVNASVTSGSGTVASAVGKGSSTVVANVNGVGSGEIALTFFAMNNGTSSGDLVVRMRVLVGDTNGNGVVNASDVGETKSQGGQLLSASNFRADVNANGAITASDVSLVKSQVGSSLPAASAPQK